ncbi:MAG: TerC family protein [Bryobacteraceae bacterium]|nr:TerC family protein [Bryobacteraceae bacterium]
MLDWLTPEFLLAALNIVLIDILLAGDNAVLIALAVRRLTPREKRIGIAAGSLAAVILRVGLTFVATKMLAVPFLKIVGGILILWIAVKLLQQGQEEADGAKEAGNLLEAMWMILVADVTMSLDNIIAIAGASKGHIELVIFGLVLSIPFVVFASNWLSGLMEKYPMIVWIGAAILGKVAGEMIVGDPWTQQTFAPPHWADWLAQALLAAGVVLAGKLMHPKPKQSE